jgi:hypothetical protein
MPNGIGENFRHHAELRMVRPCRKNRLTSFTECQSDRRNLGWHFTLAKNCFGPTAPLGTLKIHTSKRQIRIHWAG